MRTLPTWAKDRLTSRISLHFDFKDRIKILLGWRPEIKVETDCENVPGKVDSTSDIIILKPDWWPRRKRMTMGCVESPAFIHTDPTLEEIRDYEKEYRSYHQSVVDAYKTGEINSGNIEEN